MQEGLIDLMSKVPEDIDAEDILEKDFPTGGSSQPATSHAGRAQGRGQRNLQVGGLVQLSS